MTRRSSTTTGWRGTRPYGVGIAKPDEAIFDLAIGRLGVAPEAVWHVGDSLVTDVRGARNARLGAGVWLNRVDATRRPGDPAPSHEIATLRELPGLVDRAAGE